MEDILEAKLDEVATRSFRDGIHYAESWLGQSEVRSALARFYSDLVLRHRTLLTDQVAVTASATAAIDVLLFALCDEGDAVVTPAPYYGSYRRDVEARARCKLIAVESDHRGSLPALEDLERRIDLMEKPPRVLLLSNPQNPLGTYLCPDEIARFADLACRKDLHLIVDEVFALSIFDPDPLRRFVSALDLNEHYGDLDQRIHVVYSASKDLALSGFRLGCVFTRNPEVIKALEVLNVFASPGVPCQNAVASLLNDRPWLEDLWIPQLRLRLKTAWAKTESVLRSHGLKVAQTPRAGHFCLLDLLDTPTTTTTGTAAEVDGEIWKRCMEAGVLLTPGAPNMGCSTHAGLFRLCYAGTDEVTVTEGIRRLTV